ncbi:hypothetical protein [Stenotrophomonas mori]|uniref:Uncharacterized protein n=1 Tax=Stenotrophomonas mori TaxID=2871096 RepID=A0ABT0SGJ7_9GAMM|nr:hypothetical protein [Stenotrophomonas mori]MCL7714447.1 hypothetical protein [Stenotrophomonas mori]
MNDFADFRGELEIYAGAVLSVSRMIRAFEFELKGGFDRVKNSNSFNDCVDSFDLIFSIQRMLSVAKYKYEFHLSDFLDEFVYKFDRDDLYSREYLYEVIKGSCGIEDAVSKIRV